ncbi:MAG TPA: hypothetical protein VG994_16055 [Steroidobacteraceae bacterium]|nr:hypothetical protein [Steroidobacteraceae bacterium]
MLRALLLGICTAGWLAACTTAPSAPDAVAQRTANTAHVDCLTTGTRIALKQGECANVPGRVFTQEDLERTGAINPAEALRMLDPSIGR